MKGSSSRFWVLILVLSLSTNPLYSQEKVAVESVIVTFEVDRNKDQHGVDSFYWILPVDSITDDSYKAYPLYLESFTKDNLDDCLKGNAIDIFVLTTASNLSFEEGYEDDLVQLQQLIKDNRKQVQAISKKWGKGYRETIKVYITPLVGTFCSCEMMANSSSMINYTGELYLPVSSFDYNEEFWESEKCKMTKFIDYSEIGYESKI